MWNLDLILNNWGWSSASHLSFWGGSIRAKNLLGDVDAICHDGVVLGHVCMNDSLCVKNFLLSLTASRSCACLFLGRFHNLGGLFNLFLQMGWPENA
jgi:hypothetical protein